MHRASHPLAFWLSLGIAITGALAIIAPATFEQSSTTLALPEWLRTAFDVCYALGGLFSAVGVFKARFNLEAAGMTLLATTFSVLYLSIIYVRPSSAVAGIFILTLAIGCGRRAWHLSRQLPR